MKKKNTLIIALVLGLLSFSQENDKQLRKTINEAKDFVYQGNELLNSDDFISAEMKYRKAISKQPNLSVGAYNLAHSYFKNGNLDESLYRNQQAATTAKTKQERHRAFHNMGNILMQNKKCTEAVDAYKHALRNDPSDDETRYNLALAQECAKQQQEQEDKNGDNNRDKEQNQNKDKQDKQEQEDKENNGDDKKDDKKNEGDKDKNEGEDKKDNQGKPKDDKKDQGKGEDKKQKQPQHPKPQQGQLSPQRVKSLLEAVNNQEQKVQEKINAEKVKGVKIKTEKDW